MNSTEKFIIMIKELDYKIPRCFDLEKEAQMIIQRDNLTKALIDTHGFEKTKKLLNK